MSVAPVSAARGGSLSETADGVAFRTGAWVVVERFGTVLTHGAGRSPCLPAVAATLVAKHTEPLRSAVRWIGGGRRLHGTVGGVAVTAVDLGDGGTAWFIDGPVDRDLADEASRLLAARLGDDARPVTDSLVESLIHPRGPVSTAPAPAAVLVVLTSNSGPEMLARAAVAACIGLGARVHTLDDCVVVAATTDEDARAVAAHVRERCPDSVAGLAAVAADAPNWAAAGRLARAAAAAAHRLGIPVAGATAPAVVAELVLSDAFDAAAALGRQLGRTPVTQLEEYDARSGGELLPTLRAWCAAGFDYTAVAETLHVHVNTIRYRIRRVSAISGLDLTNPRHALALQLLLAW